jgi:excisionase family DNA binding protein
MAGAILAAHASTGRPQSHRIPNVHNERVRALRIMDRLLTAGEVAERLGMRTDWVWAQARAGRIPHVRLGRYRRVRASTIEAWLQELETGGVAPPTARANPIPLRRHA